jgi:antitoxin (DNA-binding transcriptional repressor) of toxin-antitoxin stability system
MEVNFKMPVIDDRLMVRVSIDEIKRDLLAYLRRVEAGESLVIIESGKPVASTPAKLRPFGLCAGEFTVPDDFDAPLPEEIVKEFEGR